MNYYKQVAEMLGLELEQEFSLINSDGEKVNDDLYKIIEDGICYQKKEYDFWVLEPSITLACLLKGLYKAVPKPWKPKDGEDYWCYSPKQLEGMRARWHGSIGDFCRWKCGNCFRTKEEAKAKGKEIMEQIQKEYEEV